MVKEAEALEGRIGAYTPCIYCDVVKVSMVRENLKIYQSEPLCE